MSGFCTRTMHLLLVSMCTGLLTSPTGTLLQTSPARLRTSGERLRMSDDKPEEESKAFNVDVDSFFQNKGLPWNKDPSEEGVYDPAGGSIRKQILDNGSILLPLEGYRFARPIMKKAFAAASRSGSDNGWIDSLDEFKLLMKSVGEDLSEEDFGRLYDMCLELPVSFNGQPKGTVTMQRLQRIIRGSSEKTVAPTESRLIL